MSKSSQAGIKLVISDPKLGRSLQKEIAEDRIRGLIGIKLGETLSGTLFDFPGYEFKITGGSDVSGVPMRADFHGGIRKRLFLSKGPGFRPGKFKRKGVRRKRMVRGNMITEDISQINLIITKWGKDPIFKEEVKAEEKTKEDIKEETEKE